MRGTGEREPSHMVRSHLGGVNDTQGGHLGLSSRVRAASPPAELPGQRPRANHGGERKNSNRGCPALRGGLGRHCRPAGLPMIATKALQAL